MAKKTAITDPWSPLLKKRVFTRASQPNATVPLMYGNAAPNSYSEAVLPSQRYVVVTQDQFLAELDPRSHDINSRLIYPDKVLKNASGEIDSITFIARVSVALQQHIATKQCVHLFAKPLKFTTLRTSNDTLFARFKEYWTQRNASSALYLMAKSALTTGDGAVCFYMNKNSGLSKLDYKVWSYRDGDQLIPVYDEATGEMKQFIRRYSSVNADGVAEDTLDVYDATTYKKVVFRNRGWVEMASTAHGFTQIPVVYHREPDVAWGAGQDLIDKIERLLSDLRESNAYFAFGIMFLKGEEVTVLPKKDTQGKVITSTDSESDAKILGAPDMSGSLKFEYEQYMKELRHVTGTVIIDPEMLKGGDQSGAYIKNLYNDAIQYALDARPRWQPALEKIVSVVKEGLGLEEKSTLEYGRLVVICEPDIYIPMNSAEEQRIINECFTAGTLSQATAAEIGALSNPDERKRLADEAQEKADREVALATAKPQDMTTEVKPATVSAAEAQPIQK